MVWPLGDSGQLSTVDTSAQLAELRAYVEIAAGAAVHRDAPAWNRARHSKPRRSALRVRVAAELRAAGRQGPVDATGAGGEVPATPEDGAAPLPGGRCPAARENPRATITFGPYLPTDLTAALDLVVRGVQADVLSLETGVRILIDAGFPIEDATLEVERIRARAVPPTPTVRSAAGSGEGSEREDAA